MLLKNLIKNISKNKENIQISGLSTNSKKVKKILFFLQLKEANQMEKNIFKKLSVKVLQLLFVLKVVKLKAIKS